MSQPRKDQVHRQQFDSLCRAHDALEAEVAELLGASGLSPAQLESIELPEAMAERTRREPARPALRRAPLSAVRG